MLKVVVLSPYAGEIVMNVTYAMRAMKDSLDKGEAPFLSHLLYPRVYEDNLPQQRAAGLKAEHAWLEVADAVAAYIDRGVSPGMKLALRRAKRQGIFIVYRKIGK